VQLVVCCAMTIPETAAKNKGSDVVTVNKNRY
jgi:hypothetical protein